jgi:predicted ATPase
LTRRTSDRFWVVTGGPGSGKTALIEALAAAGFARVPEAGRAVIREQVAQGGEALPWTDPAAFAAAMLERDLGNYAAAAATDGPVFFDRGLPDIAGYRALSGLPACAATEAACRLHRYNRRVFIAPPWPAIYANDAERRQTPGEAELTYRAMAAIYPAFGYQLVELPRASVAERVAFVRRCLE